MSVKACAACQQGLTRSNKSVDCSLCSTSACKKCARRVCERCSKQHEDDHAALFQQREKIQELEEANAKLQRELELARETADQLKTTCDRQINLLTAEKEEIAKASLAIEKYEKEIASLEEKLREEESRKTAERMLFVGQIDELRLHLEEEKKKTEAALAAVPMRQFDMSGESEVTDGDISLGVDDLLDDSAPKKSTKNQEKLSKPQQKPEDEDDDEDEEEEEVEDEESVSGDNDDESEVAEEEEGGGGLRKGSTEEKVIRASVLDEIEHQWKLREEELQNEIATLQHALESREKFAASVSAQLEENRTEGMQQAHVIADLERSLLDSRGETENMSRAIDRLTEEKLLLEAEILDMNTLIESLKRENEKQDQMLALQLQRGLDPITEESTALLMNQTTRTEANHHDSSIILEEIAELRLRVVELEDIEIVLKQQETRLREEIAARERKELVLESQLQRLAEDTVKKIKSMQEKGSQQSQLVADAQRALADRETQLAAIRTQLQAKTMQVEQLLIEKDGLTSRLVGANKQLSDLQEKVKNENSERVRLQRKINLMQKAVSSGQDREEHMEQQFQQIQSMLDTAMSKLDPRAAAASGLGSPGGGGGGGSAGATAAPPPPPLTFSASPVRRSAWSNNGGDQPGVVGGVDRVGVAVSMSVPVPEPVSPVVAREEAASPIFSSKRGNRAEGVTFANNRGTALFGNAPRRSNEANQELRWSSASDGFVEFENDSEQNFGGPNGNSSLRLSELGGGGKVHTKGTSKRTKAMRREDRDNVDQEAWNTALAASETASLPSSIPGLDSLGNKKELVLQRMGMDSHQAVALAMHLSTNAQLKRKLDNLQVIDLTANRIGPDGAKALCHALSRTPSVRSLILRHNLLGGVGAVEVGRLLTTLNIGVEVVDLSHNKIESKYAQALGGALWGNTSLREMDLSGNPFGDEGVVQLSMSFAEGFVSFEELRLEDCKIGNVGCEAIAKYMLGGGPTLLDTIETWRLLAGQRINLGSATQAMRLALAEDQRNDVRGLVRCLDLSHNPAITDRGIIPIALVVDMQTSGWLEELDLMSTKIGTVGAAMLAAANRRPHQPLKMHLPVLDNSDAGLHLSQSWPVNTAYAAPQQLAPFSDAPPAPQNPIGPTVASFLQPTSASRAQAENAKKRRSLPSSSAAAGAASSSTPATKPIEVSQSVNQLKTKEKGWRRIF